MSDSKNNPQLHPRRQFLKLGGASLVGFFALSKTMQAIAAGEAKLEMVSEKDPTAVALGYVADAKKVDVKKFPKRAGAEGAKQFCYNCQFYQAKGDPKAAKTAPCTIFAAKGVQGQGWCNSWTQNPTVKS